ncbi:sterol desaturase family protein [Sphingomonas sp.]|uniref:sterol desaturase family protein n=1 Tax=Sphingomonas sp. TaxID=28214 RepID=UPI0031E1F37D
MESLASIVALLWPGAQVAVFVLALVTAIELLLPRDKHSLASRIPALIFWTIWSLIATLIYAALSAFRARLGIAPLIVLPSAISWTGALALVATPLIAALVSDFFFYWCHRAQHRWLWRYHAVHHSIRELNSANSFHHFTEPMIQSLLIALPVSLILSESAATAPLVVLLLHLQSAYIHSSARLHLGPLRRLLVDNRFHRIHHSLEPRHFDRNFGAITPLWDRLFGTACFPARGEWPATGIAGIDQPRTLREWIDLPWRYGHAPLPEPAPLAEGSRSPA